MILSEYSSQEVKDGQRSQGPRTNNQPWDRKCASGVRQQKGLDRVTF
jgi:hypothetical protein